MKLAEYIRSNKINREEFAEQIGVKRNALQKYMRSDRAPSDPDIVRRIFVVTGGQVTANDFYGIPTPPGARISVPRPEGVSENRS